MWQEDVPWIAVLQLATDDEPECPISLVITPQQVQRAQREDVAIQEVVNLKSRGQTSSKMDKGSVL